jgi:hypothetical protein
METVAIRISSDRAQFDKQVFGIRAIDSALSRNNQAAAGNDSLTSSKRLDVV